MTSVRKSYISNSVQKIETGKESERKLLNLISADIFSKDNKVCEFMVKISIINALM